MPAERLSMRKVREVLRLKYACGASERVIARSVGIGRTAIGEYIRCAAVIGRLDDTAQRRTVQVPRDNQGETAASIRMRMRRGWTAVARA